MSRSSRVQVSFDDATLASLYHYAELHNQSNSGAVRDLVIRALEMIEDAELSKIADERALNVKKWHTHEEAWGDDA